MAHEWEDPIPNTPAKLAQPETRRCKKCGAVQKKVDDGQWMRVKMRWLPLVGRCPGIILHTGLISGEGTNDPQEEHHDPDRT